MITEEFDLEVDKDVKKITSKVVAFYGDVKSGSPVDTGEFRDAWELVKKDKLTWVMQNQQKYASILWNGYNVFNGKAYGSKQGWGLNGGKEILMKFNEELRA